MKYLYLSVFLFALSCGTPKKDSTKNETSKEVKTETEKKKADSANEDLIVILKRPNQLTETKELVKNSGLVWDKLVFDQEALKVGVIKVPAEKREFWLNKLIESGQFDDVKIYSEKNLRKVIEKEKKTLVSIKKTPCFGDCPTYEITINKDGNVVYVGKENVLAEGKHIFKLTDEQLKAVKEKLAKKDFSTFKRKYDNPNITDLPSTYIKHNGNQIHIRIWKDVPAELADVHEYIQDILLDKKFVK